MFVNLAAIDILSQYPHLSVDMLNSIRPTAPDRIPDHPLDRCLDLFFLNTAEHFSHILSPEQNEELLIAAALPYLEAAGDKKLLEIFEAAHSVILSVLAAPQNADLAARHLPFYLNTLFTVQPDPFPISARRLLIWIPGLSTKFVRSAIQACLENCTANHSSTITARQ
jgi:hypothetical protein